MSLVRLTVPSSHHLPTSSWTPIPSTVSITALTLSVWESLTSLQHDDSTAVEKDTAALCLPPAERHTNMRKQAAYHLGHIHTAQPAPLKAPLSSPPPHPRLSLLVTAFSSWPSVLCCNIQIGSCMGSRSLGCSPVLWLRLPGALHWEGCVPGNRAGFSHFSSFTG